METKFTRDERKTLSQGIDALIASTSRKAASESDVEIKELREKQIQQLVILKNKIVSYEL